MAEGFASEQNIGQHAIQESSRSYDKAILSNLHGFVKPSRAGATVPSSFTPTSNRELPEERQVESTAPARPIVAGDLEAVGDRAPLWPAFNLSGSGYGQSPFAIYDDFAAWMLADSDLTPGKQPPARTTIVDGDSRPVSSIPQSTGTLYKPPPMASTLGTRASNQLQSGDPVLRSGSGQGFAVNSKWPYNPLDNRNNLPTNKPYQPSLKSGPRYDSDASDEDSGRPTSKRPYLQYQEHVVLTKPRKANSSVKTSKFAAPRVVNSGGSSHPHPLLRKHQINLQAAARSITANIMHTNSAPTPCALPITVSAGDHLELEDLTSGSDMLPYKHVRMLGHGGTASVEMVQDSNTGLVYARKIVRNVYTRNMKEARKQLHHEVKIMRRLAAHYHIVKVHATYIAKRELAIILDPVADGGDLASFLQDCRDGVFDGSEDLKLRKSRVLHQAFGCLATGLAFIHKQTIRHKDIKPQNILIHRDEVLYTDFGLSYDFGDSGQSTTTGPVQGLTRRYCAPEVAAGGNRNSKSDVFSLGCVYLEIIDGLHPGSVNEAVLAGPFHEKLRELSETTEPLWPYEMSLFSTINEIISDSLLIQSSQRPTASGVASRMCLCHAIFSNRGFEILCQKCLDTVGPLGG